MSSYSAQTALRWITDTNGHDRYGPYPQCLEAIAAVNLDQDTIATDEEICAVLDLDPDQFAAWPEAAQETAQDLVDHAVWDLARAASRTAGETAEAVARYSHDGRRLVNSQEVAAARTAALHLGVRRHEQQAHLPYRHPHDHRQDPDAGTWRAAASTVNS